MKVTKQTIDKITNIQGYRDQQIARNILASLLVDLSEMNQMLDDKGESYRKIYIDYIDVDTDYSPERTDPCPNYKGLFTLRFETNPYRTIGDIMTLNELDGVICALYNFIEFKS